MGVRTKPGTTSTDGNDDSFYDNIAYTDMVLNRPSDAPPRPPRDYNRSNDDHKSDGPAPPTANAASVVLQIVPYPTNATQYPIGAAYPNVAFYPATTAAAAAAPGMQDFVTGPNGAGSQVIFVQQAETSGGVPADKKSFVWHYVSSCIVCWFCFCIFGFTALILTLFASDYQSEGKHEKARSYGRASSIMSTIGLCLGIVAWSLLIWWMVVLLGDTCNYKCEGYCYTYMSYTGSSSQCYQYYDSNACYSGGYCYYS